MTKTSFASLSLESLATVAGGYHEPDDNAHKYVETMKKDVGDWWQREKNGGQAVIDHKYGKAAQEYGMALLDEVSGIGDALGPILGGGVKVK